MKTAMKAAATLTAILSMAVIANAAGPNNSGNRQGQRQGQKSGHQCRKGASQGKHQKRRQAVRERFDKNDDGKLGPKERAHAKKAIKKHHQSQSENEPAS